MAKGKSDECPVQTGDRCNATLRNSGLTVTGKVTSAQWDSSTGKITATVDFEHPPRKADEGD